MMRNIAELVVIGAVLAACGAPPEPSVQTDTDAASPNTMIQPSAEENAYPSQAGETDAAGEPPQTGRGSAQTGATDGS